MLSSADVALAAADPGLPGLPVLLDDARLTAWLHKQGAPVSAARRRYLRYKPGTSCVLEAEVATPSGRVGCVLSAYGPAGGDKLEKTVERAPSQALLAVDRAGLLVATTPAADRDLPALAVLADPLARRRLLRRLLPGQPGLSEALLEPLHHKPQRRWVGLLTPACGNPVVLRVYPPGRADRAVRVGAQLAAGVPLTPEVLGADLRLGVVAVQYLPGQVLDRALSAGRAGHDELAAAGRALGSLHSRRLPGLPLRPGADEVTALHAAAGQLAVLLPALRDRAARLADRLAAGLSALPVEPVPLHGDFSTDQVVVGADGAVAFIDLDAAGLGDAAVDLACAAAALAVAAPPEAEQCWVGALHRGYAEVRPLPAPERLALHTSALLLRRSVDPFRLCAPGWPAAAGELLGRAETAAPFLRG